MARCSDFLDKDDCETGEGDQDPEQGYKDQEEGSDCEDCQRRQLDVPCGLFVFIVHVVDIISTSRSKFIYTHPLYNDSICLPLVVMVDIANNKHNT